MLQSVDFNETSCRVHDFSTIQTIETVNMKYSGVEEIVS